MITQRRSRMRRVSTGKPIALTPRDLAIFRWLFLYRYLRSTYLHAVAGGASETRFKERLGDLFHEGYVDRPEKQWEYADARYQPALYEMGRRAERVLSEHGCGHVGPRTYLVRDSHRQFAHSVMVCESLASIEIAARADGRVRFIGWPEILAKAPAETRTSAMPFCIPLAGGGAVIPDAIFGLEYRSEERKAYRFFALEIDRGTMPVTRSDTRQTSLLAKLSAYRALIKHGLHRSHLGVPNLLVLTITINESRLAGALGRLTNPDTAQSFLFKVVPPKSLASPAPDLLSSSWQRAGIPPLGIGEAG